MNIPKAARIGAIVVALAVAVGAFALSTRLAFAENDVMTGIAIVCEGEKLGDTFAIVRDRYEILDVLPLPSTAAFPEDEDVVWRFSPNVTLTQSGERGETAHIVVDGIEDTAWIEASIGTASRHIDLTVNAAVMPQYMRLNVAAKETLRVGKTLEVKANIFPDNTTERMSFAWTLENNFENVVMREDSTLNEATRSGEGLLFAARKAGTVFVIVDCLNDGIKFDRQTFTLDIVDDEIEPTGVKLPYDFQMALDERATIDAEVLPINATGKKLTWSVEPKDILLLSEIVTDDGAGIEVTAQKEGKATVTVTTANGFTDDVEVTVVAHKTPVTGIELDKNFVEVVVGETAKVAATVLPETATNRSITWVADATGIADVKAGDGEAEIKGVAAGETTVTVTTKDGGKTATFLVRVRAKATPTPSASPSAKPTATATATPTIVPSGTATPTTSGAATATPTASGSSSSGTGSGGSSESSGSKGSSGSGGSKGSSGSGTSGSGSGSGSGGSSGSGSGGTGSSDGTGATPNPPSASTAIPLGGVTAIELSRTDIVLAVGGTTSLLAQVTPSEYRGKELSYYSTNGGVVSVDRNGNLRGVAAGKAQIVVMAGELGAYDGVSATCDVQVVDTYAELPDVLCVGSRVQWLPGNTGVDVDVNIVSSDYGVLYAQGSTLEAKMTGRASLTARVSYQDVHGRTSTRTYYKTVDVILPANAILLDRSELNMAVGDKYALVARVTPSYSNDGALKWTSSDPAVATVDLKGKVTAVGAGSCYIEVQTRGSGVARRVPVTVTGV